MRVCAACRERHPADKLLRFVRTGTRASADPLRLAPGRGLNIHPSLRCLELAIKRRAFKRGLGVSAGDDLITAQTEVVKVLEEAIASEGGRLTTGHGGIELSSPRRGERYAWLQQCLNEFTFTPANGTSHCFASGDTA